MKVSLPTSFYRTMIKLLLQKATLVLSNLSRSTNNQSWSSLYYVHARRSGFRTQRDIDINPLTLGRYLRVQQVRSGMSSMHKLLSIV